MQLSPNCWRQQSCQGCCGKVIPMSLQLNKAVLKKIMLHSYILLNGAWIKKTPKKHTQNKQEAHGPWFAHLSDTAMQMLCNIFPILSLQLMKISLFEQFLVLKKNIWAWQSMEHDYLNKLSITFQQKDQCEIWWKLAKWFLKNHNFIHVNSTVAGKYKI